MRNIPTKRTGLSKCKRALAHNAHIVSSLTVAAKCLHQICVAMLFVMHVSSPNNHVRTSSRTHAELYGLGCESGAEWAPGTSYGSGSSLQKSFRAAPPTVPAATDPAALHPATVLSWRVIRAVGVTPSEANAPRVGNWARCTCRLLS